MMNIQSLVTICSLFLLSVAASAAASQELAPMVVTATMTEQSLDTATGTVQVIDSAEIAALAAEDVGEVLRRAAGINILTGTGRSQEISIRGLGAGHTLVLLDGRRITGGYNATVDVKQIPVLLIDQIEIVRGPGSALYGSEATGGVINIITKRPPKQTEASIDLRGGVGRTAEQALQGMIGSGTGAVRANLAAAHYQQDGWDTAEFSGQEIDETELDTLYTRAAVDLAPGQTLSLGAELSRFKRDGLRYYMNLDRERNGEEERQGGFLQYELKTDDRFTGMLRVYGNQSEGSYHFTPDAGVSDENQRELLQFESRGSYRVSDHLTLTAGGEVRWETLEGDQLRSLADASKSDQVEAAYGQFDWSPLTWLNFVGSLRFDDYQNSGSHLTPRLVATVFIPHGRLWTSYGQGFRAATLDQMYGQVGMRQGKDLYIGNENLDPETSNSFEVGAEMHSSSLRGQLSCFYNELDDLIVAECVEKNASNINIYQYHNVESAKTYGVELETGVTPTERLDLSAQATWLQTENEESGEELANEPKWKGELAVNWQAPWIETEIELRYFIFGESEDGSGETRDGYDLVSLYLSKQLTESLRIYAGSDNLLDEKNDYFYQDPLQIYAGLNYQF